MQYRPTRSILVSGLMTRDFTSTKPGTIMQERIEEFSTSKQNTEPLFQVEFDLKEKRLNYKEADIL